MSSSATQPMSDSPSNRMGRDSISKSNGLALDRRDSESDEGKRNEIVILKTFCNVAVFWQIQHNIECEILFYFIEKRLSKLPEKDRKIGHRRINVEGEVSYKKIHSNQLIASIQLGIQVCK